MQMDALKYFSLLGLDGTKPGASPYGAEFHFAVELWSQARVYPMLKVFNIEDTEVKVFNRLQSLRGNIKLLALRYFGHTKTKDKTSPSWRDMVEQRIAVRELVLHAGSVADCGDEGEAGWDALLTEPDLRVALVCGIVWKIVKDKVLESLLFGGTESQSKALAAQERSMINSDGKRVFSIPDEHAD